MCESVIILEELKAEISEIPKLLAADGVGYSSVVERDALKAALDITKNDATKLALTWQASSSPETVAPLLREIKEHMQHSLIGLASLSSTPDCTATLQKLVQREISQLASSFSALISHLIEGVSPKRINTAVGEVWSVTDRCSGLDLTNTGAVKAAFLARTKTIKDAIREAQDTCEELTHDKQQATLATLKHSTTLCELALAIMKRIGVGVGLAGATASNKPPSQWLDRIVSLADRVSSAVDDLVSAFFECEDGIDEEEVKEGVDELVSALQALLACASEASSDTVSAGWLDSQKGYTDWREETEKKLASY